MAVMQNSIIFGGVDSADFGIYIGGEGVFNAPKRAVEYVQVPGRSGAIAMDLGYYENIEVEYPAFNYEPEMADFIQALRSFRNAICSQTGYQRLSDTFHPDEYRMAVYSEGLEVDPVKFNTASEFTLKFNCKPQRYLISGESAQSMGEWGDTETATGDIVTIDNPDGLLAVKSLTLDMNPIQDLNGYDKPWAGGAGANKWDEDWEQGSIGSGTGTNTDSSTAIRSKNYIPVTSGETYYAVTTGTKVIDLRFYDANQTYLGSSYARKVANVTFTVPSEASYMRFAVSNYGTTYNHDIAINYPSTVTTYSPYSNICPISGRSEVVTSVSDVNVWDEEWEQGGISVSSGQDITLSAIRSKNYSPCNPSTNYYAKFSGNGYVFWYDANKTYINHFYSSNSGRVTQSPQDARYFRIRCDDSTTYNNDISINYPSTDHEYHAYVVHQYTTSLGQTVYGGTLDVVSGELTVDRVMIDLGSLTWEMSTRATYKRFYATATASYLKPTASASDIPNAICSQYPAVDFATAYDTLQDKVFAITNTQSASKGNLNVVDNSYADATAFKTAMSGVQVVAELNQPQTYQLTPQEIELLTGTNHLWSGGEVTVEYGDNPAILYNPTPFDASPLLEVEGYGSIEFNGYSIEIDNAVIGSVSLKDQFSGTFNSNRYHQAVINFDSALLDNGDEFAFTPKIGFTKVDGNNYVDGDWKAVYLESVTHTSDSLTGASTSASLIPSSSSGNKMYNIATQFPEITFNKGTALTYQNTAVFSVTATVNGESRSSSNERFITIIEYDGADTITFSYNSGLPNYLDYFYLYGTVEFSGISGESTKSILGDPTYIDCDLGDAYLIEDGEYVSLNSYIDLGSDLPTLASGANEVTFSSTITSLKIIPRWWIL